MRPLGAACRPRPERGGEAVLADCAAWRLGWPASGVPVGVGICEVVDLDGRVTSAETVDWRGPRRRLGVRRGRGDGRVRRPRGGAGRGPVRGRAPGSGRSSTSGVGTGTSACLVVGGRPHRGARGNAIILGAPPVERVAGGAILGDRAHDPAARVEAAAAVGRVLAVLVNALDPEAVVVGGGHGSSPGFVDGIAAALRPEVWCESTRATSRSSRRRSATRAGVIGAALAAVEAPA